jgi:hypothetical protein
VNFNEHFIFCGAQIGGAQIDLQVLDANQNVVADAPAYLQINDIKQMYERWTVGDLPNNAPVNTAYPATEGLPVGASAFQYTPPQDTNITRVRAIIGRSTGGFRSGRFQRVDRQCGHIHNAVSHTGGTANGDQSISGCAGCNQRRRHGSNSRQRRGA